MKRMLKTLVATTLVTTSVFQINPTVVNAAQNQTPFILPSIVPVTFHLNDSTGGVIDMSVAFGTRLVFPEDPQRNGYDFAGWVVEGSNSILDNLFPTFVTNAMNVHATWDIENEIIDASTVHTVFFDLAGGTWSEPEYQLVNNGSFIVRPANDPVRAGYIFRNWYIGSTFIPVTFAQPIHSPVTVTAGWDEYIPTTTVPETTVPPVTTVPSTTLPHETEPVTTVPLTTSPPVTTVPESSTPTSTAPMPTDPQPTTGPIEPLPTDPEPTHPLPTEPVPTPPSEPSFPPDDTPMFNPPNNGGGQGGNQSNDSDADENGDDAYDEAEYDEEDDDLPLILQGPPEGSLISMMITPEGHIAMTGFGGGLSEMVLTILESPPGLSFENEGTLGEVFVRFPPETPRADINVDIYIPAHSNEEPWTYEVFEDVFTNVVLVILPPDVDLATVLRNPHNPQPMDSSLLGLPEVTTNTPWQRPREDELEVLSQEDAEDSSEASQTIPPTVPVTTAPPSVPIDVITDIGGPEDVIEHIRTLIPPQSGILANSIALLCAFALKGGKTLKEKRKQNSE